MEKRNVIDSIIDNYYQICFVGGIVLMCVSLIVNEMKGFYFGLGVTISAGIFIVAEKIMNKIKEK